MAILQKIRDYFSTNTNKNTTIKELVRHDISVPSTVSSSDSVERVSADELENCYIFDPIVFNSINKIVQTIMSAGYEIKCENESVTKYFKEFLNNVGLVGEETTWEEMLSIIYQNQLIYGRHYIELVYNPAMTRVVDLVTLDPKTMDYARDGANKVVLDFYQRPIGYTQQLPLGIDIDGKGDPVPNTVTLKTQQIFLLPERIAHFKLYTYGNRYDGLGIIEPAYKSIVRRQNIEEAQANSIYARGTYPVIASVGDESHHPTPEMMDNAANKLAEMKHNRYFAFPYWYKINTLEVKQSEVVDNTMKYLRENSSASLGVPIAFAVGSGEATNRATLNNQQKFLEYTLNDISKRTIATIRKQIFMRICNTKKFEDIPQIIWGDIGTDNKDDKAIRLNNYVKNGILTPEEVKNYVIRAEELELQPVKSDEPHELSKPKKVIKNKNI
uniref:Putative portal protein n=1 Tax=viral metagenome TaxID=1070528 RepID=A0A6M3ISY5_9ZZZZ